MSLLYLVAERLGSHSFIDLIMPHRAQKSDLPLIDRGSIDAGTATELAHHDVIRIRLQSVIRQL